MDESIGSSMDISADDTYETEIDAAPDTGSDEMLDTAEDIPEDIPEDIAEDVPADIPEDVPDDLPLDIPEDLPEDVPEDVPEDIPEDVPADIPEDLPEDVPEDFPEDGPARVLKRDEMDLLNSGNAAINDRLEVQADEYRDQGLSEDEIADRIAADRWRFQQEFLNDAFPGQDVSPNVFNAFSENGTRDRIKDLESSPFLQEELQQEDAGEIPVPEEVPAPAPDMEFLDAEEETSSEEAPVDAQDTAPDEIPEDIVDDYQVQTDVDDTGNLPSDMDEIPEDTAGEMVDDTAEEPARDVPLSFEEDAEGEWKPVDDGYYHAIPRSEIPIVQDDGTVKSLEEVQQELETKEPYHAIPNSELDRSLTGEDTDTDAEAPETLPDQTDTVLPDLEISDSIASEMPEDSGDIQPEDTLPDATPESFDREVSVAADIKSVDDVSGWLGDINPNFDAFDPESPYCNNCGSCAYAVYQRLEGSTDSCASADNIGYNRDMEALTGMEQVSMSPDEIRDRLLAEGDGAHAIIGIDRAEGPGHWFNAACMDGKVVAIDGQTGEITDWPPDYGDVVNWEMSIRRGDK